MNLKETQAIIEAVLFAAGEPVTLDELCNITELDPKTLTIIIGRLKEEMNNKPSGLQIIQVEDAYQLTTQPKYHEYIAKLVEPRRMQALSNAALEALSIIAYNQPVTRSGVEFIRGVNSDGAINRLIERSLVEECGRMSTPGKPLLYRTTQEFLRSFGLNSINDLPDIKNTPLQLRFDNS